MESSSGKKTKRGGPPSSLMEILAETLRGKPAETRIREGKIWTVWEAAVGKQIAARARPLKCSGGILTVGVSSAAWMQQLSFLRREITEKINTLVQDEIVREIRLTATRIEPAPAEKTAQKKPSRPLSTAENERIRELTAVVSDPDLRMTLQRLMQAHFSIREPTE